jgi:tetratricopeptide (TPR) repeat protein
MNALYGRDSDIDRLVSELALGSTSVSFMYGKTGIGKSAISYEVACRLSCRDYVVTTHEVEGGIQGYEEPFIRHLKDLIPNMKDPDLSSGRIVEALSKNPENKLAKIISGVCQDVAKKIGVEKSAAAIGDIFEDSVGKLTSEAKLLASQDKESFYTDYIKSLETIGPYLSKKSVLIIDQIENASEQLQKFLIPFSKNKPKEFRLLLIVNDEKYLGIQAFNALMPELHSLLVQPIEITNLTSEDLKKWVKDEKNVLLPGVILSEAILRLDGRPELLRSWVDNGDYSLETLRQSGNRNFGFYKETYDKLSSRYAKDFLSLLGSFPNSILIDLSIISEIIGIDESVARDIVRELEDCKFIVRVERSVKLRHQLLKDFIEETTIPLSIGDAKNALNILEKHFGFIAIDSENLPLIEAKKDFLMITHENEDLEFVTAVARKQLVEGAYRSAIQIIDKAKKNFSASLSDELDAQLCLIAAESFGQIGLYNDGISQLKDIDRTKLEPVDNCRMCILLGKLYVSINKYDKSIPLIEEAEKTAISINNPDMLAKALIYKGHIYRDNEKYQEAYLTALQIKDLLMDKVENDSTRAHLYRSVSRAMSSIFMPEAIDEANNSILIAEKLYSKRHQGNGSFTLGEAHRLNKEYDTSFSAYEKGLEIALSLGNKDLEIYCLLGLTAATLASRSYSVSGDFLRKLEGLDAEKFPVESLHYRFLNYIYGFMVNNVFSSQTINAIATDYKITFHRLKPGEYLNNLHKCSNIEDRSAFLYDNPIRF